jgi:cytochrome c-type biogenesis protein CcmH
MTIYLVFACVAAVVLAILVHPLLRRGGEAIAPAEHDLAVYRDQLAELERDADAGHISAADAEAARNEISRRMLAARDAAAPAAAGGSAGRQRAIAALALVLVPGLAAAAYAVNGRPDMPAAPLADRLDQAVERGDFPAMVARVEQHLQANPEDANGWAVLGPAYLRLGRDADAANAYTRLLQIRGPNADAFADLGEALVAANDGLVSAQARTAFDEALKLNAMQPKARFYRTLADEQTGDRGKALEGWKALLADTPADAAWKDAVEQRIAALENPASAQPAPAPPPDTVADAPGLPAGSEAIQQLPPDQQQAMIRGMVDRLDERLKAEGGDLGEWLRLARARAVLGERDRAVAALDTAADRFKNDAVALAQIDEARRTLGLDRP